MKNGLSILDIIFCVFLVPGMMFLFPVGEWALWHPGYVALFSLWLYGVWALCRFVLGPLLRQGWRGVITVAGILFLLGAVQFLMSLTRVDFPEEAAEVDKTALHIRAMWVLFLAVVGHGIPVGALRSRIAELETLNDASRAEADAARALESRRAEADTGDEIQVKSDYKTIHIPLSAIRFIEGRNNYACFHLDNREDVVSQIPLKDVLEMMPPDSFVRIHRSYIVPMWRIEKRKSTQVLLMGVEEPLPVGRAYKDNLNGNNG